MASRPAISPRHPVFCPGRGCDARIWWKNITTPAGLRNLPLQADPDPAGTVAARPFSTLPGRFLAATGHLADGEQKWINHFDTCPTPTHSAAADTNTSRRHASQTPSQHSSPPKEPSDLLREHHPGHLRRSQG